MYEHIIDFYHIVIRQSRYSGVYEGGKWHAIANARGGESFDITYFDYLYGDDDEAIDFWQSNIAKSIGVGDTPNSALEDLYLRINS